MNHRDQIKAYMKNNNGIITAEYCKKNNIPQVCLSRMVKYDEIYKVCTGVYAFKDETVDNYFLLQLRNPNIVYSYYTALELQGQTEFIPPEYWITVPNGYKINNLNFQIKINYVKPELLDLGITTIESKEGNLIKCYSYERVFCDLIKNFDKHNFEFADKAIVDYLDYPKRNDEELYRIAKVMGIENKVIRLMRLLNAR